MPILDMFRRGRRHEAEIMCVVIFYRDSDADTVQRAYSVAEQLVNALPLRKYYTSSLYID